MLSSNHKEYSVPLKELEKTDGMPAKEVDLPPGAKVIWLHKGKRPYEGHIVDDSGASQKRKAQCELNA